MPTTDKRTILVLDDDEINLMILMKGVVDAGYVGKPFTDSGEALEYMLRYPREVDIALLDKMMPGMDGIEMLKRMKSTEALRHIPVIIQTGDVGVDQMREGIDAGAYYYLTKPFHPEIMAALLRAAANECVVREELKRQIEEQGSAIQLLARGEFSIRTHDEARRICAMISQAAVYPEFVMVGLMELLANAIEHGNLEIGGDAKRELLLNGQWEAEVARRLNDPMLGKRSVKLSFEPIEGGIALAVKDEGHGFDWRYQADHTALLKLNEPNGRGIAKALVMLDKMNYVGMGNEVRCEVRLKNGGEDAGDASTPLRRPA